MENANKMGELYTLAKGQKEYGAFSLFTGARWPVIIPSVQGSQGTVPFSCVGGIPALVQPEP